MEAKVGICLRKYLKYHFKEHLSFVEIVIKNLTANFNSVVTAFERES